MNNEVRGAVAASLESQFKQMTWKKDSFKSISIDENYKVSVLNNKDFEILSKLSAGERLCLSFAFSLTLSTVAGLNFPMVVDTPMGRLSPEAQVNLSTVLAEVTAPTGDSTGHQMIMLMTETEYNPDVAKALSVRKPKVFEIQFDTERAETQIGEE
jgi:DNA sulfur modification protein DndD